MYVCKCICLGFSEEVSVCMYVWMYEFIWDYVCMRVSVYNAFVCATGKFGFECFSHRRAVLRKDDHAALDIFIRSGFPGLVYVFLWPSPPFPSLLSCRCGAVRCCRYPPYSKFNLKCLVGIARLPFAVPHLSKRALLLSLAVSLSLSLAVALGWSDLLDAEMKRWSREST